jgi:hypothetical protein
LIARELVQCLLPHKNPGNVPAWQRTNGDLTLIIQAGWNPDKQKSYGLPYGTVSRLLLRSFPGLPLDIDMIYPARVLRKSWCARKVEASWESKRSGWSAIAKPKR